MMTSKACCLKTWQIIPREDWSKWCFWKQSSRAVEVADKTNGGRLRKNLPQTPHRSLLCKNSPARANNQKLTFPRSSSVHAAATTSCKLIRSQHHTSNGIFNLIVCYPHCSMLLITFYVLFFSKLYLKMLMCDQKLRIEYL